MLVQWFCNPIFAKQVTFVDDPPEPFTITVNHQEIIAQHAINGVIGPFNSGYCRALMGHCLKSLEEVHRSLEMLGDWTAGRAGCLFHSGNSLSNSALTNCSINARWLIYHFSQSMRISALQSIDSLKLVGCLICGIVAHFALRVKVQNGWT